MVRQITEGISVSVETFYQPAQSDSLRSEFLFAYRISIQNLSEVPMQLLRRHWDITDSNGIRREVDGEGVVGHQPIIEPGSQYQYSSAVDLRTEMGKMSGYYQMQDFYNKKKVEVAIPEFQLIVPHKLN
jgi:ApaG protein